VHDRAGHRPFGHKHLYGVGLGNGQERVGVPIPQPRGGLLRPGAEQTAKTLLGEQQHIVREGIVADPSRKSHAAATRRAEGFPRTPGRASRATPFCSMPVSTASLSILMINEQHETVQAVAAGDPRLERVAEVPHVIDDEPGAGQQSSKCSAGFPTSVGVGNALDSPTYASGLPLEEPLAKAKQQAERQNPTRYGSRHCRFRRAGPARRRLGALRPSLHRARDEARPVKWCVRSGPASSGPHTVSGSAVGNAV